MRDFPRPTSLKVTDNFFHVEVLFAWWGVCLNVTLHSSLKIHIISHYYLKGIDRS